MRRKFRDYKVSAESEESYAQFVQGYLDGFSFHVEEIMMTRITYSGCRGFLLAFCLAMPALAAEPIESSDAAAGFAAYTPLTSAQVPAIDDMIRLGGRSLVRGMRASWSPDGQRVVFATVTGEGAARSSGGVAILELDSGYIRQLTDDGDDPSWSPADGRWITYTTGTGTDRELWVIEVLGGEPRKLAAGVFPYWGSDGRTIFFYSHEAEALMQIAVDDDSSEATKVIDVPYRFPTISPDTSRIAYRSGQWLHVVDRETGQTMKRYILPGGSGYFGDFSPDGRHLAFSGFSNRDIRGLWIVDLDSDGAVRLTDGPFYLPSWSKDGRKLLFTLSAQAGSEVWMIERPQIENALIDRIALDAYVPPASEDTDALLSYLRGNAARQAAAQARHSRRQQTITDDLREELAMLSVSNREVARKVSELETNRESEAYLTALEILLPEKVQALATTGSREQAALLADIQRVFHAKAAKGLTANDANLAMSIARSLETSGNNELAAQVYRDFGALFGKSTDPLVARYRSYLDAGAKRLAILGTPMQVAGTTFEGQSFDWESYRGKIVLVDFWATWCAPCRAELPNLKNCYAAYKDQGFTVVGISLDRDRDGLGKYLASENIPWVTLHEKDGAGTHPVARHYGISAIPAMYLVDRDGRIVSVSARGPQLVSLLAKMLGPPR
jgi:thiol-disulfide isomerase/thioredoxin